MISAVFFLGPKGELVLSRVYRDDINRGVADAFKNRIVLSPGAITSPVNILGSTSFFHLKVNDVFVVAVVKKDANAALVFQYLNKMCDIFKSYFRNFDEATIRNNFVLMYELLDEIIDFGYPQTTEVAALKQYITQGGIKMDASEEANRIAIQATGAVSWRKDGIKYRKNEVFLDVYENINLLMSAKGTVLHADVSGQIIIKSYLSGMPECKFGLNDRLMLDQEQPIAGPNRSGKSVEIDDCTFHPCVKLSKFDTERSISFIPPDGEFELMKYRTSEQLTLPFKLHPIVRELGRTRLEANVTVKSQFGNRFIATNVVVIIPCPKNTADCVISTTTGKAKYDAQDSAIIWRIRRFPGMAEQNLTAEINLIAATTDKKWSRPPISMQFQVPMFAASGVQVRYLKVFEKSKYDTVKWVRYITKAGSYQYRI
eukprot:GCRY01003655.1.p1 GENE.GCRY01003655.1~~GCRY01003655.1.p1  ORF type:complete len:428 (+),score=83.02 GCRY01003655.1:216-1499(+)